MRFRRMAILLLIVLIALPVHAALAEAELIHQHAVEGFNGLHLVNGTYTARLSDATFAVFSADGTQLSTAYRQIDVRQDMPYYIVTSDPSAMNGRGLVDGAGQEVLPTIYGRIDVIGEHWIFGCVVENWSEVVSTDVYFDGRKIGSLSAEDYTISSYTSAHGAYIGIGGGKELFYLNSRFERVPSMLDYLSEEYFHDWNTGNIYHLGSGQRAFDPACTLSADEVERAVWYDGDAFLGLQGQTLLSGKNYNSVEYPGGDYLLLRGSDGMGLADMRGMEVLPPLYSQLGGHSSGYFAAGYQAALKDGDLAWLDLGGHVTATVNADQIAGDLQGFEQNGLFLFTRTENQAVIFTATAGALPQRYEDAVAVLSPLQRILCVKQNGLWGAIDLEGRTVIPFAHEAPLQISHDGTVAVGQNTQREQVVYAIAYHGEAVVAVAPAAKPAAPEATDKHWLCPDCGQLNDLNFCSNCGAARPEAPAACGSCGYTMPDGSIPNFCPNCGAAFQ